MGSDSICGLLLQTPTALLIIEDQVSSTRAIYLHMLQLPKNRVTLEYVHDHPHIPRECGRTGSTGRSAIVTSNIRVYSSVEVFPVSSPMSTNASDSPCRENRRVPSNGVYSPWSSGEYISPESSHLLGSITVIQQLTIVTQKYNLQAPRLLALHAVDNSTRCGAVTK